MFITGTPGIKLITNPANTNKIGYATFILLASIISNNIMTNMPK
jgi:hypothetical protein